MHQSGFMKYYRTALFTRIVPAMKDIGLWGEKIRTAYAQMGILELADVNLGEIGRHDERVAEELDARRVEVVRVANSVEA